MRLPRLNALPLALTLNVVKTLCCIFVLTAGYSATINAEQRLTLLKAAPTLKAVPTLAAPACFDGIGSVFKNCLDPTWQKAFTTSPSHWQIINLEGVRQNVIDITFNGQSQQIFGISAGPHSDPNTPHNWLDLTAFKNGKLHFDIRVLDYASNINGFEVSLGCGKGCQSLPIDINPVNKGQWQRVSIGMYELISSGLEITQIHTGFEIKPVDGEHHGVHIQLDNIEFDANIPAPMDLVAL